MIIMDIVYNGKFMFRTYIPTRNYFKYWGFIKPGEYKTLCPVDDLSLDELLHSYTDRCTSLCDKTNKVVYENDILVNEYGDNYLVKFQIDHLNFGRICLLNINNINSDINKDAILIPCCIEDSKVIGNSWENKELLKEN